ncbi:MAG TPA: PfkB family carbohydrate kinase, partial [Kofleriaceae bacterium]|nr:PfkB family carbohydrate kinase [Kofleriaceae bacterium]
PLADDLIAATAVIRPNAAEAEVLTGIEVKDRRSAARAGGELRRRGAAAACIGAPGGNLLCWSEGELWLPHLPVPTVDATGAGDAFAGALAVALAENQPLPSAVRFAHAAAAWKTTRLGAQAGMPRRAQVLALLQDHGRDMAHA